MKYAEHLGDGAYVHFSDYGEVVLTANHHDPREATDTVILDARAVQKLQQWLKDTEAKLKREAYLNSLP